ncbi:MAG TPA: hypothetical protein VFR96_00680 [Povalibacter sp.]|nr:hypothetical protein [Povalibacter sp.]
MEGADTALLLILLRLATQVQARTQQAAGEGQGRHLLVIAHGLNLAVPPQPLQGADSRGIDGQYAFARQEPQ